MSQAATSCPLHVHFSRCILACNFKFLPPVTVCNRWSWSFRLPPFMWQHLFVPFLVCCLYKRCSLSTGGSAVLKATWPNRRQAQKKAHYIRSSHVSNWPTKVFAVDPGKAIHQRGCQSQRASCHQSRPLQPCLNSYLALI